NNTSSKRSSARSKWGFKKEACIQVYSFVVYAFRSPPTCSSLFNIWCVERRSVRLKSKCSIKCATPKLPSSSRRDPDCTIMQQCVIGECCRCKSRRIPLSKWTKLYSFMSNILMCSKSTQITNKVVTYARRQQSSRKIGIISLAVVSQHLAYGSVPRRFVRITSFDVLSASNSSLQILRNLV